MTKDHFPLPHHALKQCFTKAATGFVKHSRVQIVFEQSRNNISSIPLMHLFSYTVVKHGIFREKKYLSLPHNLMNYKVCTYFYALLL